MITMLLRMVHVGPWRLRDRGDCVLVGARVQLRVQNAQRVQRGAGRHPAQA
jgi:hypothetical protein